MAAHNMALPTAPVMAGVRAAIRGIATTNAGSRSALQPVCSARLSLPLAKQFVSLTPRANRTLRRRAVVCMASAEQQEESSSRTVAGETNLNVIIEKERRLAEAEAGLVRTHSTNRIASVRNYPSHNNQICFITQFLFVIYGCDMSLTWAARGRLLLKTT